MCVIWTTNNDKYLLIKAYIVFPKEIYVCTYIFCVYNNMFMYTCRGTYRYKTPLHLSGCEVSILFAACHVCSNTSNCSSYLLYLHTIPISSTRCILLYTFLGRSRNTSSWPLLSYFGKVGILFDWRKIGKSFYLSFNKWFKR